MLLPETESSLLSQSAILAYQLLLEQNNIETGGRDEWKFNPVSQLHTFKDDNATRKYLDDLQPTFERGTDKNLYHRWKFLIPEVNNWIRICPDLIADNVNNNEVDVLTAKNLLYDIWSKIFDFLSKFELASLQMSNRSFRSLINQFKLTANYKRLPFTHGHSGFPSNLKRYVYNPSYSSRHKLDHNQRDFFVRSKMGTNLIQGLPNAFIHYKLLKITKIFEIAKSQKLIACVNNDWYILGGSLHSPNHAHLFDNQDKLSIVSIDETRFRL